MLITPPSHTSVSQPPVCGLLQPYGCQGRHEGRKQGLPLPHPLRSSSHPAVLAAAPGRFTFHLNSFHQVPLDKHCRCFFSTTSCKADFIVIQKRTALAKKKQQNQPKTSAKTYHRGSPSSFMNAHVNVLWHERLHKWLIQAPSCLLSTPATHSADRLSHVTDPYHTIVTNRRWPRKAAMKYSQATLKLQFVCIKACVFTLSNKFIKAHTLVWRQNQSNVCSKKWLSFRWGIQKHKEATWSDWFMGTLPYTVLTYISRKGYLPPTTKASDMSWRCTWEQILCICIRMHLIIFNTNLPQRHRWIRNKLLLISGNQTKIPRRALSFLFVLFCFREEENPCSQDEDMLYAKCQRGAHCYSQLLNPWIKRRA